MSGSPQGWLAPIVIRAVSSLAVGGFSYAIVNAAGGTLQNNIILSVFIGGVVLVVQFLAGLERRVQRAAEDQRRNLSDLDRATRLHADIEKSPISVSETERFIVGMTAIQNSGLDMAAKLAMSEFNRVTGLVDDLINGQVTYEGEDREWLLSLTQNVKYEMVATSSVLVDDALWDTRFGDRYLKEQSAAVRRGVAVRRLFAVDDEDRLQDAAFKTLVAAQQGRGVKVKFLLLGGLSQVQQGYYRDFVIFDKRLYYLVQAPQMGSRRSAVVETTLSSRALEVETAVERFDEFWELAQSVP